MKRDIENKFIELFGSLSIVAEQLTIAENNYLTNGKWDIEKIKEQPFTVIHDENTKDNLIDLYKKELGYFKNIEDELDLLEITDLIAEIETNLQSSMHPDAYIKGLLLKIVEVMDRVKDYTKNKYRGGLAIEKLENLKRAFLYNLHVLCVGFNIDVSAIIQELEKVVNQSQGAGQKKQNDNTTEPPQQYQLTFTKELEQKFLAVYSFWHGLDSKTHINIFKDITQQEFTNMVCHADFSGMTTTNILQKVQMTVYVLSKLINDEWGKRAAQSLNTDIATCQKRCSGDEGQAMKSKFLQ